MERLHWIYKVIYVLTLTAVALLGLHWSGLWWSSAYVDIARGCALFSVLLCLIAIHKGL